MIIDSLRGEYELLRNFAATPFVWRGLVIPTLEHGYQAEKTDHPLLHLWVRSASSPAVAKRRGRVVPLGPDWYARRVTVMRDLLHAKFTQHAEAARVLLSTGDASIVEGNMWHDQFWGDCRCGRRTRCAEPGDNQLGIELMATRERLLATRFLAA